MQMSSICTMKNVYKTIFDQIESLNALLSAISLLFDICAVIQDFLKLIHCFYCNRISIPFKFEIFFEEIIQTFQAPSTINVFLRERHM